MTTSRLRVLLMPCLLAAPLLVVSHVRAQTGPGMGFGPGYYDASSSMVIDGVVETVEHNAYNCRWGATEVTLKAEKVTYVVQLGPTLFLAQHNFRITDGDRLRVRGFKFTCQGTSFLIARDVTKRGKTLTLAKSPGLPARAVTGTSSRSDIEWFAGEGRLCCACRCLCW